jgi:hypothetical protein
MVSSIHIYMYYAFILQPLNVLGSQDQERELEEVLERLKTQVRTRRLMLYTYFRDFDRVSAQS